MPASPPTPPATEAESRYALTLTRIEYEALAMLAKVIDLADFQAAVPDSFLIALTLTDTLRAVSASAEATDSAAATCTVTLDAVGLQTLLNICEYADTGKLRPRFSRTQAGNLAMAIVAKVQAAVRDPQAAAPAGTDAPPIPMAPRP